MLVQHAMVELVWWHVLELIYDEGYMNREYPKTNKQTGHTKVFQTERSCTKVFASPKRLTFSISIRNAHICFCYYYIF